MGGNEGSIDAGMPGGLINGLAESRDGDYRILSRGCHMHDMWSISSCTFEEERIADICGVKRGGLVHCLIRSPWTLELILEEWTGEHRLTLIVWCCYLTWCVIRLLT